MCMTRSLAIALLISALAAPVRAQSTPADLGAAGWRAMQQDDGDAALQLFAEALALSPEDAVLHLGAGSAAHMLGRDTDAADSLKRALDIDPTLTVASRLLGEIAVRSGDLDLAIATYEQALVHAPDNVELSARLDRLAVESERRASAGRIALTFAGPRDDLLAGHAAGVLNAAYWRVAEMVGARPSDAITVALDTRRPPHAIDAVPAWNDAQYDGRLAINASGAAGDLDAFDRVLTHQLTHAMISSMAPTGVPSWLHEGLAQIVEPADVAAAELRLKAGAGIPWTGLTSILDRDSLDAQACYDASLLMVRALLDRVGGKSTELLDDLADGQPLDRALARFGFTYADLQADVARRLR
jgi:tetratricopeptide (TPR) repeat protein